MARIAGEAIYIMGIDVASVVQQEPSDCNASQHKAEVANARAYNE
jgi:hypothetical protein